MIQCTSMPERQPFSKKRREQTANRRVFIKGGIFLGLVAATYGISELATNMTEQDKRRNPRVLTDNEIDNLRREKIGRQIQKPEDAISFPGTNETVIVNDAKNIRVSLNGEPEGLKIYYSPFGIRALKDAVGLENPSQLHLYTFSDDDSGDATWQEGNCTVHMPMPYTRLLYQYVLPQFPPSQWVTRQGEIVQEWNNRIQAVTYH